MALTLVRVSPMSASVDALKVKGNQDWPDQPADRPTDATTDRHGHGEGTTPNINYIHRYIYIKRERDRQMEREKERTRERDRDREEYIH